MTSFNKTFFISGALVCILFAIYAAFIAATNRAYGQRDYELFLPADRNANTPETKIGELSIDMPLDLLPLSVTSAGGVELLFIVDTTVKIIYSTQHAGSKSDVYPVKVISRDLSTFTFLLTDNNFIYHLSGDEKSGKAQPYEHPSDYQLGYFEIIRPVQ